MLPQPVKRLRYLAFHHPLLANPPTRRTFNHHTALRAKQLPPRPTINEAEVTESFLRGSGPGGQKINKTCSAVQLIHAPSGIVVRSQATRSRSQNRKIARRILAERLEVLEKGSESRVALKAEVKRKRKASKDKKARRKYRLLDEERRSVTADDGEGGDRVGEKEKSSSNLE